MKKRIKKPTVKPELRQEWLRRYESGETPPKIADSDDFDVRTVRKHIDLAKQDRDVREARSAVLRGALEQHYRDMYDLALELDSTIVSKGHAVLDSEVDRRLLALRQHLPRSPLWTNLPKWNRTLDEINNLNEIVEKQLRNRLEKNNRLNTIPADTRNGIIQGLFEALYSQFRVWSQGKTGLNHVTDIHIEKAAGAKHDIRYGGFHMSPIDNENLDDYLEIIRAIVQDYETRMKSSEQYLEALKSYDTLRSLQKRLRDELAIIIMRRIVPGKCKYCPL
ncbi:MAG TPA: hypothetical protein G4O18_01115 [Dehalococcoidia bacterium]|nr:hypothetical protein [Dehalococcoidia bacterium]